MDTIQKDIERLKLLGYKFNGDLSMNKEYIEKGNEYLCKNGCISVPFLQQKLNLSYQLAKQLFEILSVQKEHEQPNITKVIRREDAI